ncbi:hypothetical protein IFM89_023973 [Coptis chinensis]|uniref:Uncharacterized protein n=1 Tax=Coptis chinensis TaxID=261450 RepID=A0A835HP15_9MAGN|nr:hypothetical protein IFM89_023973 [Coptis chinensis]
MNRGARYFSQLSTSFASSFISSSLLFSFSLIPGSLMWTQKPASNWLDRLRSSKGFPLTNDQNLETFLNQKNPNQNSTPSSSQKTKPVSDISESPKQWFSTMSNVLAELFIMEEDDSINDSQIVKVRKSCRKQANPKVCVISRRNEVKVKEKTPSSSNSVTIVKGNEGGESKLDLLGYSRLDLVVIDTSIDVWKTEKLVLRKGDVWKVREKKNSRLRSLSAFKKKKRKFKEGDKESDDEKKKKKKLKKLKKKKKKEMVLLAVSEKGGGEECGAFAFEVSVFQIPLGNQPREVLVLKSKNASTSRKKIDTPSGYADLIQTGLVVYVIDRQDYRKAFQNMKKTLCFC